jgi:hypothetical protein
MTQRTDYKTLQAKLSPTWLRKPVAQGYLRGLGRSKDELVAELADAVRIKFLRFMDDDALALKGAERSLERFPGEDTERYRARLLRAWEFWRQAGTTLGIQAALSALGYNSDIRPVRVYDPARWAEFDVWLYPGSRTYPNTPEEAALIRRVINKFKTAHEKIGSIRYVSNTLTWNPPLNWNPAGVTWGDAPITI